jgi:hypothetical protein
MGQNSALRYSHLYLRASASICGPTVFPLSCLLRVPPWLRGEFLPSAIRTCGRRKDSAPTGCGGGDEFAFTSRLEDSFCRAAKTNLN